MDQWRWDVFSGKISPAEYNCKWWQLRNDIQGIEPPVDRSEEDFDPASKYHIIANVPYVRYVISLNKLEKNTNALNSSTIYQACTCFCDTSKNFLMEGEFTKYSAVCLDTRSPKR